MDRVVSLLPQISPGPHYAVISTPLFSHRKILTHLSRDHHALEYIVHHMVINDIRVLPLISLPYG